MKQNIHIMHPDPAAAGFLRDLLELKGFTATCSETNVESFYAISKADTDLLIMNKESPYLDAEGFFIKKNHTPKVENLPVFMLGDFSPKEIQTFKACHVEAFLPAKLHPAALIERVCLHLGVPLPPPEKKTPMLLDIHAKDNTLIVQVEGNLETDKLLILNHRIRMFLRDRKLKQARVLFIIPSLYPDHINETNLDTMFRFLTFKELDARQTKVAVLTKNKAFLELLAKLPALARVKVVENYYEGFQSVTADFDPATKVPIDFIKPGNTYFLDLFDPRDILRLKAQTPVSPDLLETLKKEGVRFLQYYGKEKDRDKPAHEAASLGDLPDQTLAGAQEDVETLECAETSWDMASTSAMDYITKDYSAVSSELVDETATSEKQSLFFSSVKGQHLLFVSLNPLLLELVQQALSVYFTITNVQAGENIKPLLMEDRFAIIFLDLSIPDDMVFRMLHTIRSHASRRKTTIILMGTQVTKAAMAKYMHYGTNHIILQPYSTEKFFNKVYQSVTADRQL